MTIPATQVIVPSGPFFPPKDLRSNMGWSRTRHTSIGILEVSCCVIEHVVSGKKVLSSSHGSVQ